MPGERNMRRIARKIVKLFNRAIGNDLSIKPDIICETERLGSMYGGWVIAGAYIDSHSIVYSFGIGEDASFDTALIGTFNVFVHAFDPTPRSIDWVRRQQFSHQFIMHEYGIAAFDGEAPFNPPEDSNHVSHTMLDRPSTNAKSFLVPVKRLSTIMQELGHTRIDLLKMDIEGAEYEVIDDIAVSGIRPRQILVEFHHRFPNVGIEKTRKAIDTLKSMGYRLFSISASNEELCFIGTPESRDSSDR